MHFFHELAIFKSVPPPPPPPKKKEKKKRKEEDAKTLFPTIHPFSPVIFATATVVAFVLLSNSRFSSHGYTQREATPYSEVGPEMTLRLLATCCAKDYKGHSLVQTCFTEAPNSGRDVWPRLPPFLCLSDRGRGGNGGVRSQATRSWVNTITELYHQPGVSA